VKSYCKTIKIALSEPNRQKTINSELKPVVLLGWGGGSSRSGTYKPRYF